MKSLERLLQGHSLRATYPGISQNLPGLPDVTFPTLGQLASRTQEHTQPSTDLFSAIVQDPRELLQDYMERPEAHRHEVLPIVLSLVTGTKSTQNLTEEERSLLNSAALTYAERSKPSNSYTNRSQESCESKTVDPEEVAWGDEESEGAEEEYGVPTKIYVDTLPDLEVAQTRIEAPKEISLEDFTLAPGWWKP